MELPDPATATSAHLVRWLRDGDRILVGQGSGEPAVLMRLLAEAAAERLRLTAIIGASLGPLGGAERGLMYESCGALGTAAQLPEAALTVLPLHYSQFIGRIVDGRVPCDVVFVQLSPPDDQGRVFLGMGDLHLIDAARRARVVCAEINPYTPHLPGTLWPDDVPVHVTVTAAGAPMAPAGGAPTAEDRAIAAHVAGLVPDRAVLQLGIGRLPDTIARALKGHRDLGLHSGTLTDAIAALIQSGALTNAAKESDAGLSVTGVIFGGVEILDHVRQDRAIEARPAAYTHAAANITRLSRFHAINSAVEVDLTGQINAESAGGRRVGGTGGQVDFTRGAQGSRGGRAIVALPSTARGGAVSRIVPRVSQVTIARSDADTVVTEWGVAELAGCPLEERARRMIDIAAPQAREDLSRYWHDEGRARHG
ncbi:4-hydroxybutyrate CoA-transferase [Frigidibacter albus]|uniref:4-hydroxybutyrate CoA-transferase n=1 Tax=Frigidibacter albus TaxID=1465486 RepID=A0A6L8VBJ6_9RHOB|nr:acetyl-CoA hydrolase/transferase C-terminal domain-containing protein [Frigidibacter albus]MZQ87645.1 4-hydroxybutyrate CoA-transferase [Frigidibacter albus]NBE29551.1 4-hydroxybutyrate CoA-transferase [Frigidibacter albus]GGH44169.1 4-hydroxybutyrate CoA-transferase [Frigidibacter albus]